MITRFDTYILTRLLTITVFVLLLLIFIFIVIDFSENSDDFTDRGATLYEIWFDYYLNYIPEMIRLVTPVAVFVACLLLTGKMSDHSELTALKSAGVSLYRLMIPYLFFAAVTALVISYLDGYIVPESNKVRFEFEREYISGGGERIDRDRIYRQESPDRYLQINYFDASDHTGYRITLYQFGENRLVETIEANRMRWIEEDQVWEMVNGEMRTFTETGYLSETFESREMELNLLPRDLARTSSDVYRLTYPEIIAYLQSIERSGAGGLHRPQVQFYGKVFYPISILVVTLIGVSLASERRTGGRGVHVAFGLGISFLYLATMRIVEPFGHSGAIDPLYTALTPHLLFMLAGIVLLLQARK